MDNSQCIFLEKAVEMTSFTRHPPAPPTVSGASALLSPHLQPLGRGLILQDPQSLRSSVVFCSLSRLSFPVKLLSSHGKFNLIK